MERVNHEVQWISKEEGRIAMRRMKCRMTYQWKYRDAQE